MVVQPSGTDAKDVALHFHEVTSVHPSSHTMSRAVVQAKRLLQAYEKDDIIRVIDKLVEQGERFYSLGYVEVRIDDVITKFRQEEASKQIAEQFASHAKEKQTEVLGIDESTDRNRDKLDRFGVQSGVRKKYHFDLFERP